MDFSVLGKASMIPGMQYMLEQMQQMLDDVRAEVARLGSPEKKAKRGRRPGPEAAAVSSIAGKRRGWAKYSTEEARSEEMKRRMRVRLGLEGPRGDSRSTLRKIRKAAAAAPAEQAKLDKLHPRDPRSPRHMAWVEIMRQAQLKRIASLSPKEKKAQVARMHTPKARKKQAAAQRARAGKSIAKLAPAVRQHLNGEAVQ
jgi:hypothetical protein